MNHTLGEALSGRDNALNFLRLVLAAAVIFGHTYPITGTQPVWPSATLAGWAVHGFFAMSGFLIAGSRLHLGFWTYMWRRAARILPGFWAVLAVTAFIFAPVSTLFTGRSYTLTDGLNYVTQNLGLWLGELAVGETLADVPHANSWNGSLWTLFFEFGAYVIAGVLLAWAIVRRHQAAVLTVLILGLSAAVAIRVGHEFPGLLSQAVPAFRLGSFFVAGMLVHAVRHRIRVTPGAGAAALASFVLVWVLGIQEWAGQLPLTVLLLWLGAVLPVRLGSENDLSYGVYIYAFPVQQLLVVAGVSAIAGAEGSAALALLLTLPLAWASWTWVERPCLELARRLAVFNSGAARRA